MSDRNAAANHSSIEEVLQRIDAQPIPDADELANMSMAQIERQLVDLGVDTEADVDELLAQLETPSVAPLTSISAHDLEQLSLARVERHLEAEGVDVRAWLSRAETLIRNARSRALVEQPASTSPASSPATLSRGARAATGSSASHQNHVRRPRRVPRALAASIVMIAIAGVTFSILDQPELELDTPFLAIEDTAPAVSGWVAEGHRSRERENTEREPLAQMQVPVVRESPMRVQSSPGRRVDAAQSPASAAVSGPSESAGERRVVSPMVSPSRPSPPPPVSRAIGKSNTVVEDRLKALAEAPATAPTTAFRAAEPSGQSLETERPSVNHAPVAAAAQAQAEQSDVVTPRAPAAPRDVLADTLAKDPSRTAVSSIAPAPQSAFRAEKRALQSSEDRPALSRTLAGSVAEAHDRPPGAALPHADSALREEKKKAEAVASISGEQQSRAAPVPASKAGAASATTHELRAGQTLDISLAQLRLNKADKEALSEVFADVDVSRGAILQLSMYGNEVQSATLELPQGHSVSAIRNSRGGLVRED